MACTPTHEPDFDGTPVLRCCENCEYLYDDSDGPEYGPPWYRCSHKPHMENLKGFPFSTPQHCFELHFAHLTDWRKEFDTPAAQPNGGPGG